MAYKIEEIEGIGPVYGEKLKAAGVNKVDELLEKCAAKAGRVALSKETGIDEKLILKWTNHADLFRIPGVGAPVLRTAGGSRCRHREGDAQQEPRKPVCQDSRGKRREEVGSSLTFTRSGSGNDCRSGQTGTENDLLVA